MSTITTFNTNDSGATIKTGLNSNFSNLNTDKAELASPAFTGVPTAPTASVGTNTTQIATTAFVLANPTSPSITKSTSATPSVDTTAGQKLVIMAKGNVAVPAGTPGTITVNMKINTVTVDTVVATQNLSGGYGGVAPVSFLYYAIPGAQTNAITFDQTVSNLVTIMMVF